MPEKDVVPYATPAPPAPASARAPTWVKLLFSAGVGVLAALALAPLLFHAKPAPKPTTPAAGPPASRQPKLSVQSVAIELQGRELSSAIRIRNDETKPIVVRGVRFNGEFDAARAIKYSENYATHPDQWPVTLTVGESVLAFHRDNQGAPTPLTNYAKDVIFLDVLTDVGSLHFTFSEGQ